MTQPRTIEGREFTKFVESDNRPQHSMIEVVVGNATPIEVNVVSKGLVKNIFNDVNSVPKDVETLINTYTVPPAKGFYLRNIPCSGNNNAKFTVKINDEKVQVKRISWNSFNTEFNFADLVIATGDKVEIFVENKGKGSAEFESTIIGGEYDG